MSLEQSEIEELGARIGRKPTGTELEMVAAEWSEHCSYKSSKMHLKMLPMDGPLVITEKGYDSGVLDAGGGYVITAHIESHNHPSAVEPYGGAATGVGGVIRDILSAGTRPVAILDGLRFGDVGTDAHARWLFRNAVSGIADYGNCLGIPTIGGEVEFDACYSGYAMVDVAAVGFGRRDRLIQNRADPGDVVILMGGATGRDGIGGSQFASDTLESDDRSAVQIPDPFIEKLIIEAVLEARDAGVIHAMKDLGGGGLACAVSETASALGVGMDVDVGRVHAREEMNPWEIMVSESQERMLLVTDAKGSKRLEEICKKYRIGCSAIGTVTPDGVVRVRKDREVFACLPAGVITDATLLDLPTRKPQYLSTIHEENLREVPDLPGVLATLLGAPNIASKAWVYGQYDHEVGIRTVVKPGGDAAVLRLDNGRFLSVKIDGNPKHCYVDPRNGAIGCFEEACRNVVCTGARPVGMLDHLQFGNPKDPEIFWTFMESLRGISDFARHMGIPCVGGKVSLYNETASGPIKPTPLIGVLGLADRFLAPQKVMPGDHLVLVGETKDELGGSEYLEHIHGCVGGRCPAVDFAASKKNMDVMLDCIARGLARSVHDCSKGGLAVAVSEMCMAGKIGCDTDLGTIPHDPMPTDRMMFSESHSRYLMAVEEGSLKEVTETLENGGVRFGHMGRFGGESMRFRNGDEEINLRVDKAREVWLSSLKDLVLHG